MHSPFNQSGAQAKIISWYHKLLFSACIAGRKKSPCKFWRSGVKLTVYHDGWISTSWNRCEEELQLILTISFLHSQFGHRPPTRRASLFAFHWGLCIFLVISELYPIYQDAHWHNRGRQPFVWSTAFLFAEKQMLSSCRHPTRSVSGSPILAVYNGASKDSSVCILQEKKLYIFSTRRGWPFKFCGAKAFHIGGDFISSPAANGPFQFWAVNTHTFRSTALLLCVRSPYRLKHGSSWAYPGTACKLSRIPYISLVVFFWWRKLHVLYSLTWIRKSCKKKILSVFR